MQRTIRLQLAARLNTQRCYSNIRDDSSSSFAKKEKAVEDKWVSLLPFLFNRQVYDHDKDLKQKLKANLKDEKLHSEKKIVGEVLSDEPAKATIHASSRSGGSPLGGREAAIEEKYFYEHEKEVLEKLKNKK